MRHALLILCALMIAAPYAYAQGFFNTLPDVPLMTGLSEREDEALSFDKPEGRIVVGAASIGAGIGDSQLLSYYQRALPQFGWHVLSPVSYVRGNETLKISIKDDGYNDGAEKILEITISP